MDERKAKGVADALGGEHWQSGGGIWLVLLRPGDGRLIVVSGDSICEYPSDEAFDRGEASKMITLGPAQARIV